MFGNDFGPSGAVERARWMLRRLKGMTSQMRGSSRVTVDPYDTDVPEHVAYHRLNRKRGTDCRDSSGSVSAT